mgnify:CR=1 FL=1
MSESEIKIPELMKPINQELRNNMGKFDKKDFFKLLALVIEIRTILKEIKERKEVL